MTKDEILARSEIHKAAYRLGIKHGRLQGLEFATIACDNRVLARSARKDIKTLEAEWRAESSQLHGSEEKT